MFTALDSQLDCGVTSCPSLRVRPFPLPLSVWLIYRYSPISLSPSGFSFSTQVLCWRCAVRERQFLHCQVGYHTSLHSLSLHNLLFSPRLCTEKVTGDQYAVKIVSKRHRPMREVSILQLCQGHPNIVHLHEVLSDEVRPCLLSDCGGGGE